MEGTRQVFAPKVTGSYPSTDPTGRPICAWALSKDMTLRDIESVQAEMINAFSQRKCKCGNPVWHQLRIDPRSRWSILGMYDRCCMDCRHDGGEHSHSSHSPECNKRLKNRLEDMLNVKELIEAGCTELRMDVMKLPSIDSSFTYIMLPADHVKKTKRGRGNGVSRGHGGNRGSVSRGRGGGRGRGGH